MQLECWHSGRLAYHLGHNMSLRPLIARTTVQFLVERCRELGFIPLVTSTPPHNRYFTAIPRESPTVMYVKLFGHNTEGINSVQVRWGAVDSNLLDKTSVEEDNLTLTAEDRVLLVLETAKAAARQMQLKEATEIAAKLRTLGDLEQALQS